MWFRLNEKVTSASVNFTRQLNFHGFRPELRAGIYLENKNERIYSKKFRIYKSKQLHLISDQTTLPVDQIFTDENINLTNGIKLAEITSPSDSYNASNKQIAGYIAVKLPFTSKISLYTGLRVEKNLQTLDSYRQGTTIPVNVVQDTVNLFPSANLVNQL